MNVMELTKKIRETRTLLLRAKRFNNQDVINQCLLDLAILNSRVSDLMMDFLERHQKGDANASAIIGIPANKDVTDYPTA